MKPKGTTRKVTRTAVFTYRCYVANCKRCLRPTPPIDDAVLNTLDLPEEREDGIHVWPFQHWHPPGWVEVKYETDDKEFYCPNCWNEVTNHDR